MNDQAAKLRLKLKQQSHPLARTMAVVSGKGGVGKSNISINAALILAEKGYKVLLFDFDIGMGNVNILLGEPSRYTISDFLDDNLLINDVIYTIPEGVSFICAGNGLNEIVNMDEERLEKLFFALGELQLKYDFIIFDMAAGAAKASIRIIQAADDILVISTPEPTSITDAYSMMKLICLEGTTSKINLICNRADHDVQGRETLERLKSTASKFLNKEVHILGVLPEDPHVRKAVINQTAFSIQYPKSAIAKKMTKIVDLYLLPEDGKQYSDKKDSFIGKLRRLFYMNREQA